LKCPGVVEGESGGGAEAALALIVTGKNDGVEDGLSVAGFDLFAFAVFSVVVERKHLAPEVDTLFDAVDHGALSAGGGRFSEVVAEGGTGEGVHGLGVAGDAVGAVVLLGPVPALPPDLAGIEVAGGGLTVPGCWSGRCWFVGGVDGGGVRGVICEGEGAEEGCGCGEAG